MSHDEMINKVITFHFNQPPAFIRRIAIGICNEVYDVGLNDREVIIRLSPYDKYLMGSHDHIPRFKELGIKVPDILFENYSKILIPLSYQIQNKIEGMDLGNVIETLTDEQLRTLAKEIAFIFHKVKTIPSSEEYGVIWGGGDNETSSTWTERMKIWIEESNERGKKTGVMDDKMSSLAKKLYTEYKSYFDLVKPVTYYGDICSKNVMIDNGKFNGLVDLDGLTQGDPLEAVGRIKLSWYGTHHGKVYATAVMDELGLAEKERKLVLMYALLNKISWACENGIQFNQNTKPIIDKEREKIDKTVINELEIELNISAMDAEDYIIQSFQHFNIIGLGEGGHHLENAHQFFQKIFENKKIQDLLNVVILEFANTDYQDILDKYIFGDEVNIKEFRNVWRESTGSPGRVWEATVYFDLLKKIRDTNFSLPQGKKIRVLGGDPSINWKTINNLEDYRNQIEETRETFPADLAIEYGINQRKKVLVIYAEFHITKVPDEKSEPNYSTITSIVNKMQSDSMKVIGIVYSKTLLSKKQFENIPLYSVIDLSHDELGDAPASQFFEASFYKDGKEVVAFEGYKSKDLFDAFLYVGSFDLLKRCQMPAIDFEKNELKELNRRRNILGWKPLDEK